MKRNAVIFLIAATAVAVSCDTVEGGKFSTAPDVVASMENETTGEPDAAGFGPVLWKPADNINVFYGPVGVKYTSRNEEEAASATFGAETAVGVTREGLSNVWGFRPYDKYAVCSGEGVTATLPTVQYGVAGSYDDGLFAALAHSTTTDLHFISVCGGIRFNLPLDSISTITIAANAGEALAGRAQFSFSQEGEPVAAAVDSTDKITLVPKAGGVFLKDSEYSFVTLPVVMADGFTISFGKETAEGAKVGFYECRPGPVTVSRSEFTEIEIPDSIAFLPEFEWYYKETGEKALKENARREGTVVLPSGLQYRIIREGDRPKPTLDSLVKIQYSAVIVQTGQTIIEKGAIEDILARAAEQSKFGWMEVLQQIPGGSVCEFWGTDKIMFGGQEIPIIPQNSVMKFRVELLPTSATNKFLGEKFLEENAKNDSVIVLDSGLQYKVLTAGSGEVPQEGDIVKVHYWGKLLDGTVFDSSYDRGEPITFSLTQVIRGWTEALMLMPKGSKWEIYVPYQLGYGERGQGPIPAYSLLIFQIELLDIQHPQSPVQPE